MHDKAENAMGYDSHQLYNGEMWYPTNDSVQSGIEDTILLLKLELHGAVQPFLVNMDHSMFCGMRTQPYITVWQVSIQMVLHNIHCEVNHIPGIKMQFADRLFNHPDV